MTQDISTEVGGVLRPVQRVRRAETASTVLTGPLGWAGPAALALLASLAWSWRPALWTDEDATVSAVTRPLPQMFDLLSRIDVVHGAYYLLTAGWVRLAGTSAFALRLPSAVAIALATVAVVLIGRRVGASALTATAAGVAFAVLPTVSYYGMEARSVAFGCAGAAWTTWGLLRLVHTGTGRPWWALYGVLLGASTWFHLYVGLLVVVHALTLAFGRADARTWRRWAAGAVLGVALASPLIVLAARQTAQVGWLTPVRLRALPGQARTLFFEGSTPVAVVAWILVVLGIVSAAGWLAGSRTAAAAGTTAGSTAGTTSGSPSGSTVVMAPRPGILAVAVPWGVVPFAVVYAVSTRESLYTPRYLFFCIPAVALLIGAGVTAFRSRGWAAVLLALLLLAGLRIDIKHRTVTGKGDDLAVVDRIIAANEQPGDAVVYRPQTRRLAAIGSPGPLRGLADVTLAQAPDASGTLWGTRVGEAEMRRRLAGVRRVWIVDRPGTHSPKGSDVTAVDRALAADGFKQLKKWKTGYSELQLVAVGR